MEFHDIDLQKIIDEQLLFRKFFFDNEKVLQRIIVNRKHPYTGQYLFHFYKKSESIKEAIVQSLEMQNIYPAFILYRSLIEHYFKFYYGYIRLLMEKNDDVGREYRNDFMLAEFLALEMNNMTVKEMLHGKRIQNKFDRIIKEYADMNIPEGYSRKLNDRKKRKFQFKSILKYLIDNKDQFNGQLSDVFEYQLKFIVEFNKYSTFVHGGPISDMITNDFVYGLRNSDEFTKIFSSSFLLTLLLGQYFGDFIAQIDPDFANKMPEMKTIEYFDTKNP